jgi:P27 family predicted phage terminase small subunit
MRGRKPTPTAFKVLHGNPGKRPLLAHEPRPPVGLPTPPAHLGPVAREEWDRLGPELVRLGVLTMADRTTFAAYCQLYEQWCTSETHLKQLYIMKDSRGGVMQNPLLRISHRTLELLRAYLSELGLSPASRVRLARGEISVDDPLEQFLARKALRR